MNPADVFNHLSATGNMIVFAVVAVFFVANLLYYRTLQRAMKAVSPELRPFAPALVWLSLIPLVGLFWYMVFIVSLSIGLGRELRKRALPGDGALVLSVFVVILFVLCLLPFGNTAALAALPALGCWTLHWVRMAALAKQLSDPEYLLVE